MDRNPSRLIATLSLGAALALPSTALAQHGADDSTQPQPEHAGQVEQAPQTPSTETYDLRGTVLSVDAGSSTLVMQIQKANHGRRGRALGGQSVILNLAGARLQVADVNGDGVRDVGDVSAGDRVEARVRLPRSQPADLTQPVAAQRFKDRDARASDDAANHS